MNLILRIIILLICVFTLVNALVFVGISIYRSVHAYELVLHGAVDERPGLHLVESLDGFLLAIVFIIFAVGFGKLFFPENVLMKQIQISWLEPRSFTDLKHVLWEAILTTLVVAFAIIIVEDLEDLNWLHLIIPGSILLISLGLRLLKDNHQ